MKRRHRLVDGERFRQVREEGASYVHPLLVVSVMRNEEHVSRFGFTASRRIGTSVDRNRARRRMREAVRRFWDLIEPGWDLVWVARHPINAATFEELQGACARVLRRAGVLRAGA